jgi:endoglucanase
MKSTFLLSVILPLLAFNSSDENVSTNIKVDQVGYLPSGPKIAVVTAPAEGFSVKRAGDGGKVFEGQLTAPLSDPDSGDLVRLADFSGLREPGTYYLEIPGLGRSWSFAIRPDVYTRLYYLATRAFYGQRCGTAVDLGSEFPGYSYPPCHLTSRFHTSSGKESSRVITGGWHDAGDYGRYVVNSGITTGTMLWAWEMFGPKLKNITLNIPESGNTTPDFLDEIRWNLEWMLKMQDEDGGVWHKQTTERFGGFIMPDAEREPTFIIGTGRPPYKSTCATADLCAVAAIAARVYAPFDKEFAQRCLVAARHAWAWTERYPGVTFNNPPGVSTGAYGDSNCSDERLWAAAELWRATGEAPFNKYFLANYASFRETLRTPAPEGWNQLAPFALWTYALAARKQADPRAIADIRQVTVAAAREIVESTRRNPYRVSLLKKDYVWGSNGVVANYGMQLLVTNALSPDQTFVDTALENLHYLLGRNTHSLSWVTQVGSNPYQHPHHRPSGAAKLGAPWPGLLSGGPDANRQDDLIKKLPALPPAKMYVDLQGSYSSNEIAINWQAALVFMLAGFLP